MQVIYHAGGSARYGDFTAAMPGGTKQGEFDVPLTNKAGTSGLRFCADREEFLYISVQNGQDSGSISCAIEVDGITVSSIESRGAYVIATCDD